MAGTSPKEIKNRIRSMGSTKQITKAMDLVAASKLRKAQTKLVSARAYFEGLRHAVSAVASPKGKSGKTGCVVIAGDRGLAGGYNANVLKAAAEALQGNEAVIIPVGKKAAEHFAGSQVLYGTYDRADGVSFEDCFQLGRQLYQLFRDGALSRILVVYTRMVSTLSQTAQVLQVLPAITENSKPSGIWEPDEWEMPDAVFPIYLAGALFWALCESQAAEQAARVGAMHAATRNAEDMIDQLRLEYNRTRQAAITQEITQIIAGAKRS